MISIKLVPLGYLYNNSSLFSEQLDCMLFIIFRVSKGHITSDLIRFQPCMNIATNADYNKQRLITNSFKKVSDIPKLFLLSRHLLAQSQQDKH